MMLRVFALCAMLSLVVGCESTSELKQGGYRMIQMNNPECMGSSGSGILLVRDSDEHIIKAQIGQKTGYCEAITGQVISTGGDVAGDYLIQSGLGKSGKVSNINAGSQYGSPINIPPSPAPVPTPQPDPPTYQTPSIPQ